MTIRVLIVDDSVLIKEILRDIFDDYDDFEVVGEAGNGQEAVTLTLAHKPDLITMDLEMPVMDGFQAIQEIMQKIAVPILVVSSVVDADKAYRAISCGALDAVQKPGIDLEEQVSFIKKARLIAQVPVIKQIRPSAQKQSDTALPVQPKATSALAGIECHQLGCKKAVCIVSSTGGPQALEIILKGLDGRLNAPIFIAQHISQGFACGMADWLNSTCPLTVKVPRNNEPVCVNTVYISPSEKNMTVTDGNTIEFLEPASGEIYHPNCDALLESVARVYGSNAVGVILSGMGSDGHKGLKKILNHGGETIGQDEQTSVIYGMNQIAMKTGAVKKELPIQEIAWEVKKAIALKCRGLDNGTGHRE